MTRKSSSVTIHDVAREAGVSIATVSRYINNSAIVSEPVSRRIRQVMTELNYAPHAVARQLATRKTYTIGLLLTAMHNDFFGPLLEGIESVVSTNGYSLLVATHRGDALDGRNSPIGPHNTDGMIVFADSLDDDRLISLHKALFPLVLIHRTPPPSLSIPSVSVENKAATRKLINHLIEVHGKRRIICLSGPVNQEDTHWRKMGYQSALESHSIAYDPALVLFGGFEREIAYSSLNSFLSDGHPDFDAVFAGDDDAAIGVLEALDGHGLRVPEDVAVVGFDDQRLSAFLHPPLTTVHAPTAEVGRTAANQLFRLLNSQTSEAITLLPTEIILRRSCGCAH